MYFNFKIFAVKACPEERFVLTGDRSDLFRGCSRGFEGFFQLCAPLDLQVQLLLQSFPRSPFLLESFLINHCKQKGITRL